MSLVDGLTLGAVATAMVVLIGSALYRNHQAHDIDRERSRLSQARHLTEEQLEANRLSKERMEKLQTLLDAEAEARLLEARPVEPKPRKRHA